MFRVVLFLLLLTGISLGSSAASITFAGHEWIVRSGTGGPGPNDWDPANVRVDEQGRLHLKLTHRDGRWTCAEITSRQRFGFGRYEFEIEGAIDRWDPNVVLGLFNYPTGDVGGDETHEIDIEFARWGRPDAPPGNYTIWPVDKALKPTSKTFAFTLKGAASVHRFEWQSRRVNWESAQTDASGKSESLQSWTFAPEDAERRIAQKPMPVHLNLWLFKGRPPAEALEIEVVIRRFQYLPPRP
jgi:hypothetical protein